MMKERSWDEMKIVNEKWSIRKIMKIEMNNGY